MKKSYKKQVVESKNINHVADKKEIGNNWIKNIDMSMFNEQNKINVKDHFKSPFVMDSDHKMIRANEIQKQYNINDALSNNYSAINQGYLNQINNLLIDNFFMGYAELSMLVQNPLLNSICSMWSEEIIRPWITFVSKGGKGKEDKIKELEKEFERLKVKYWFKKCVFNAFAYGGCLLYPKIKGDEHDLERQKKLIIDKVKINKGDLEYLQVIEPIWYVPIKYNTDNPFSEWFYKPEIYVVMGMEIHESRVMKFMINETPNILKPTYLFNGISMIQLLQPSVMKFESVMNAIVEIVPRYNINILSTNMEALINGLDNNSESASAMLKNRIALFNMLRNNMGTLAIDKETEEYQQMQISLAHLDSVASIMMQFVCAIAKSSSAKLFGMSPTGFNSAGTFEIETFRDTTRDYQEHFSEHLTTLSHLCQLNIWGKIDEEIIFEWNPLEKANELEESQIRLNTSQEVGNYVDREIVTSQEAKAKLINDEKSKWDGLDALEKDY